MSVLAEYQNLNLLSPALLAGWIGIWPAEVVGDGHNLTTVFILGLYVG